MKLLESLRWRYATKNFDPEMSVSKENIEVLKDIIQLSVSSFGLQLYKVIIVSDPDIKKLLRKVSWEQPQVTDASHIFIFCNYTAVENEDVNKYIALKAQAQGVFHEDLKGYSDFIHNTLKKYQRGSLKSWTAKQAYIALANLLAGCAELEIDACPMEGFNNKEYNKILGLEDHNLNAAVIAAVGYRSFNDQNQQLPKIRKPKEELFGEI